MRAIALTLLGVALAQPASAAAWIEGAQDEAWLGYSVAGAGDVDGDGFGDALAGAPRDGGGAALLLRGSAAGIGSLAPLRIESDQAAAMLGSFVSGAGDVNGDGVADYALGAEAYEVGADAQGAAFVFHGAAIAPGNVANASGRLLLDDAFAGLGFGDARAGDVNDDGYDDVLVGARFHGAGGGAFVLHGSASGVGFRTSAAADARIEAEDAGAELGASFAPAGDVNGDGYDDVLVGAPEEDARGAAYLFHGGPTGLVATSTAQAATHLVAAEPGARFGFAVAGDCDVDGDGFDDVVVGAPRGGPHGGGAVYVFRGGAQGVADGDAASAALALESASADAQLGASVACGDLDGDGRAEVLAGAPRREVTLPAAGGVAVFGFDSDAALWQRGDRGFGAFGFAIAIRPRGASDAQTGWIAGAPFRSDADDEEGGVRVAVPEPGGVLAALASAGALAARRARRRPAQR